MASSLVTARTLPQVGSYDHVKQLILRRGWLHDGFAAHCAASMAAGAVAAVATSPVDVVKTRIMNQAAGATAAAAAAAASGAGTGASAGSAASVVQYRSTWHCIVLIARSEGLFGFFKGLWPNYLRIGPHTLISFVILEQLRALAGLRSF